MAESEIIALGIDLGTTNSSIAAFQSGNTRTVPNAHGFPLTPSAIYFGDTIEFGQDAIEHGREMPELLATEFKRDMGKSHYREPLKGHRVPPEVLSAFLLKHLHQVAKDNLGQSPKAVITVPAYYNEPCRQATQLAGELAGLEVIDIVNEPIAAALGYRHPRGKTDDFRMLIYDFGGGTFDVSIVDIGGGTRYTTLATGGDMALGGIDLDDQLVDFLADQFRSRHGFDPRTDLASIRSLSQVAQQAKHDLTNSDQTTVTVICSDLRLSTTVQRSDFETLIAPFVERTLVTCNDVLSEAGSQWGEIDEVLLVGGSSRVPLIRRVLEERTGCNVIASENPEEIVATGAALSAAIQTGCAEVQHLEFVNVNAHSLGIQGRDVATGEKINKILIPRNTPLPTSSSYNFVTRLDEEQTVGVQVLEGESLNPRFCTRIGKCNIHLESGLAAGTVVRVTCHYHSNGTINVTAQVPSTRHSAMVKISRESHDRMESLDIWEARFTGNQAPADELVPEILQALEDEAQHDQTDVELSDSDEIALKIGKVHLKKNVPIDALQVQRACLAALNEMQLADAAMGALSTKLERAKKSDRFLVQELRIAENRLREYHDQSASFLTYALIGLGRRCANLSQPEKLSKDAERLTAYLRQLRGN